MPPKKKKGGKKNGKEEEDVEQKFKKTLQEVDSLKHQLNFRKDLTRRAQSASVEAKDELSNVKRDLDKCEETSKVVSAEMVRQYKTLSTEMGVKLDLADKELARTQQILVKTQEELRATQDQLKKTTEQKDDEISKLVTQLSSLELQYNQIMHSAMDTLVTRIDEAQKNWRDESTYIHQKHKAKLLDLGLRPLDI